MTSLWSPTDRFWRVWSPLPCLEAGVRMGARFAFLDFAAAVGVSCPQDLATPKPGDAGFLSVQTSADGTMNPVKQRTWRHRSRISEPKSEPNAPRARSSMDLQPPESRRGAVTTTILGCLVLVVATVVLGNAAGADGATIASWISAIATVGALGAAGLAAHFALGTFNREQERDNWRDAQEARRLDAEERSQAALVSAWPGQSYPTITKSRPLSAAGLFVRNASEAPVTRLEVRGFTLSGSPRAYPIAVVPPGPAPEFIHVDPVGADGVTDPLNLDYAIELWFTDSSGLSWHRDHDHGLHRTRDCGAFPEPCSSA